VGTPGCGFRSRTLRMQGFFTIGVVGHVDHGKTSLVRSITGIDTDRLKEEKIRGLSIESGIAPLILSPELEVSLVDVPGHKDYLKNTIRGLSQVDGFILVVAANEGVMPQTLEHIQILDVFGIQKGILIITKTDLVDQELVELAELEIRETIPQSFSVYPEIIRFSAETGEGKRKFWDAINWLTDQLHPKDLEAPFRMWIDQLRLFPGYGTVASGTVQRGCIKQDDLIELLPIKLRTRARSIESHHRKVKDAYSGQRIGVNLTKISQEEIKRGMEIVAPDSIKCVPYVNLCIKNISSELILKDKQKVRVYVGTSTYPMQLVLLEKEILNPGEEGYAQLRSMESIGIIPGDRILITPLNIQQVVGGGIVLEVSQKKVRNKTKDSVAKTLSYLNDKDYEHFLNVLSSNNSLLDVLEVKERYFMEEEDIRSWIRSQLEEKSLVKISENQFIKADLVESLKQKVVDIINSILSENPIQISVKKAELIDKLSNFTEYKELLQKTQALDLILYELVSSGALEVEEGGYVTTSISVNLPSELAQLSQIIIEFSQKAHINPFSADTIWKTYDRRIDKNQIKKVLNYLRAKKVLVRINDGRFLNTASLEEIKRRIANVIKEKKFFDIHDCKGAFGYGRTVAVPILEYLDRIGFTVRTEYGRKLKNEQY